MKTFSKFVVLLSAAALVIFTGAYFAQCQELPAPGAVRVKPTELEQLKRNLSDNLLSASLPTNYPLMVIRVQGNFWHGGVTVVARSTGVIPAGTTVIGTRQYPGQPTEYLSAWYFPEELSPGSLWYSLELEKKITGYETGGVAHYGIILINGNSFQQYTADRNMVNYERTVVARRSIYDGYAFYTSTGMSFYLFTRGVSGPYGVTIQDAESAFEWVVPAKAVESGNGFLRVNTEDVPYFHFPSGDLVVTISSIDGQSDTFNLRVPPRVNALSEKQAQALLKLRNR